jgi:arylsulfatase A-like enzyme
MDHPNILLITSDQQHWDTIGLDDPQIATPNLDRLAREGLLCERAYCANPTCSPARASIVTGLYPAWHGCWTIGVKLPEDVPTVGELLQQAGYSTTLIGKAHFQPLASTPESSSLECHPGETRNLWNDPGSARLKSELLQRFLNAELKREPTRMPRIAHA